MNTTNNANYDIVTCWYLRDPAEIYFKKLSTCFEKLSRGDSEQLSMFEIMLEF